MAIAEQIGPVFTQSPNGAVVYRSENPILGNCLTPDGRHIAIVDGTNSVHLWDRQASRIERELRGNGPYSWAVISGDGKRLVGGNWDSMKVSVWDMENGELPGPILRSIGPRPGSTRRKLACGFPRADTSTG